MKVDNIIRALEHQRSVVLTQNVELHARVLELEEEVRNLTQKIDDLQSDKPDETKKT